MKHTYFRLLLILVTLVILSACAGGQNGNDSQAAATMETYLNALVEKDEALLTSLVCPDYEMDALLEYDSFQAVETQLANLTCSEVGNEGGAVLVNCQGQIEATYGNEVQAFDLGGRTYRLIQAGADWQVCGYNLQ